MTLLTICRLRNREIQSTVDHTDGAMRRRPSTITEVIVVARRKPVRKVTRKPAKSARKAPRRNSRSGKPAGHKRGCGCCVCDR